MLIDVHGNVYTGKVGTELMFLSRGSWGNGGTCHTVGEAAAVVKNQLGPNVRKGVQKN